MRFITLEGVDGAGKSSHIEFIADAVRTKGLHSIVTREPGGTDLAERLREVILRERMPPVLETLLVFAARTDHVARVIRPALESGTVVICDRFTDATVAYQGAGNGVSRQLISQLAEAAHPGLKPDRTLIFDCPYEVSSARLAKTGKTLDRFEREDRAFFDRVRSAYLGIAKEEPRRVRVIDASGDVAAVRGQITSALQGL
ncbi:MAG: dTMP kinase [Betaproteobacteria bacterium]|nr:dTMP kinase [Betaproteobacteria bacterium]MBV9361380.1 dTMP kinase [Betaproteobacteria bacterium]